jgi:hypothetical protein
MLTLAYADALVPTPVSSYLVTVFHWSGLLYQLVGIGPYF